MSDLIERLRLWCPPDEPPTDEAADEIEQLRRGKRLAVERNERLIATCMANDVLIGQLQAELKQANAVVEAIQKFIDAQAEDEGLWCEAQYASEAYIQRGLRGCHAYIESVIKDGPRAALETDDLQDKDDGCG